MLKIDEFESVFRSAIKESYQHQAINVKSAVLVTDLPEHETTLLVNQVSVFCSAFNTENTVQWHCISGSNIKSTEDLLAEVNSVQVDLIVTYRNLFSDAWQHPFSLGEHLDILVQKTTLPVLVIPHPRANYKRDPSLAPCTSAMVATDHLVNNHQLIRHGLALLPEQGQLYLTHIEDQTYFNRIIEAFSKIPSIDTDLVTEKLAAQLLKIPTDYIASVSTELEAMQRPVSVTAIVEFGHQLKDYVKHIEHNKIDLLVIDSKDGDQMAMHGLAYPLAIEIRNIPILML